MITDPKILYMCGKHLEGRCFKVSRYLLQCDGFIKFWHGQLLVVFQSFPRSVGHVAMSSKNWFDPEKGYSLMDQMTNRNLSTSSVLYVNVL
jgi:lysophospholipid acyltransferase (LPLAT)-like uncharacterized protein